MMYLLAGLLAAFSALVLLLLRYAPKGPERWPGSRDAAMWPEDRRAG